MSRKEAVRAFYAMREELKDAEELIELLKLRIKQLETQLREARGNE